MKLSDADLSAYDLWVMNTRLDDDLPIVTHLLQACGKDRMNFEKADDLMKLAFEAGQSSTLTASASEPAPSFQARVQPWMMACFGEEISNDRVERGDRFLEEVFELLQSGGYDPGRVLPLRDYVWSREAGEPPQEAGGVQVTMAAYCLAHGLDMHEAGETELARIWTKVEQIRAKQAAKPRHSPLPVPASEPEPVAWQSCGPKGKWAIDEQAMDPEFRRKSEALGFNFRALVVASSSNPVPTPDGAVTDAMVEAAVAAWRKAWNGPLSAFDPVPEAMRLALSAAREPGISRNDIQNLHAGISRRDWHSVEQAANTIRDKFDVEGK